MTTPGRLNAARSTPRPGGSDGRDPWLDALLAGPSLEPIPDDVLLSAVLGMVLPYEDSAELAERLLGRRRGLAEAVMNVAGGIVELDRQAAIQLRAVVELAARLIRPVVASQPVLRDTEAIVNYCRLRAGGAPNQQVRMFFFDDGGRLMADEVHQYGTADFAKIHPREILRRGILIGACGLVMAHTGPNADPPWDPAIATAVSELRTGGSALGVTLFDYLLIGRNEHRSLEPRHRRPAVAAVRRVTEVPSESMILPVSAG